MSGSACHRHAVATRASDRGDVSLGQLASLRPDSGDGRFQARLSAILQRWVTCPVVGNACPQRHLSAAAAGLATWASRCGLRNLPCHKIAGRKRKLTKPPRLTSVFFDSRRQVINLLIIIAMDSLPNCLIQRPIGDRVPGNYYGKANIRHLEQTVGNEILPWEEEAEIHRLWTLDSGGVKHENC
jgi:hypothetical protein